MEQSLTTLRFTQIFEAFARLSPARRQAILRLPFPPPTASAQ